MKTMKQWFLLAVTAVLCAAMVACADTGASSSAAASSAPPQPALPQRKAAPVRPEALGPASLPGYLRQYCAGNRASIGNSAGKWYDIIIN